MTDILRQEPPKMSITNIVDPSDTVFAQYNPEEMNESLKPVWENIVIPGLSHQRMNYVSTENYKVRFALRYDATGRSDDFQKEIENVRRFLHDHVHPRSGASTILGGEAPRVLLIWPTLISLQSIIEEAEIALTRFNSQGRLMAMTANITISEIRDVRLTFEEVRLRGTIRSGGDVDYLVKNS